MITVEIGTSSRSESDPHDIDVNWIIQQIQRRRADGQRICVRITIHTECINVVLATAGCGATGGGGRPPNPKEEKVFELWNRFGMNRADFEPGSLIAFLKNLRQLLKG